MQAFKVVSLAQYLVDSTTEYMLATVIHKYWQYKTKAKDGNRI